MIAQQYYLFTRIQILNNYLISQDMVEYILQVLSDSCLSQLLAYNEFC